VKFLPLIWSGLWRKPGRTILIFLQVSVAFALFGVLQGLKSGVEHLIAEARAKGMLILYTLAGSTRREDIIKDVAPVDGEQALSGGAPDKFVGLDLEGILKSKNIKTLIAVGTAAEGAVLHTAAGAAFRGFDVVVPVDAMASTNIYAEAYTAWHLANAPRLADRVKLTRAELIKY